MLIREKTRGRDEGMSRGKKAKLLNEILEELRGIRAVLAKEYPRDWETCIKEHIRRLDEETLRTEHNTKH